MYRNRALIGCWASLRSDWCQSACAGRRVRRIGVCGCEERRRGCFVASQVVALCPIPRSGSGWLNRRNQAAHCRRRNWAKSTSEASPCLLSTTATVPNSWHRNLTPANLLAPSANLQTLPAPVEGEFATALDHPTEVKGLPLSQLQVRLRLASLTAANFTISPRWENGMVGRGTGWETGQ